MFRLAWLIGGPIALLVIGGALFSDDNALKDSLALQEAVQQAIKSAEPSVACILVSRSKEYEKVSQGPIAPELGQLGEFRSSHDEKLRRLDLSDPDYIPESYGSGVVVSEAERLILTNYHVVRDATKLYVRLSGEKGSYANIHAADPRSDLAVLQLIDRRVPVKEMRLGDGTSLAKGQFVVALTHPFATGFRDGSPSASFGIISNMRGPTVSALKEDERSRLTLAQFGNLIQTDVKLNLGCSGGALVNLKGEMIGITNSLAALTGVETPGGFAMPMDDNIKAIIEVLKRGEEVEYGFLGVRLSRTSQRREFHQIESVIENSPASAAGLNNRSYIISIQGKPIHDNNDIFLNIGIALAGSKVKLVVMRDLNGPTEELTATLVKSYVPGDVIASKRKDPKRYGGLLVDYASVLIQRRVWEGRQIPSGVAIRAVGKDSPASKALLQEDKVITRVNGKEVNLPAEFYREMDRAGKSVELTVSNVGGQPYTVRLELR